MQLSVHHRTTYSYNDHVRYSAQYLHLTPLSNPSQRVLRWRIDAPGQLTEWHDAFGNTCHTLVIDKPVSTIEIAAHGRVETTDTSGVLPAEDGGPPIEVYLRETPLTRTAASVRDFAAPHRAPIETGRLEALHQLSGAIRDAVDYQSGDTHVRSPAAEALELGTGVCQDHAHVFIACCRHLGVPARYVSGYLFAADESEVASHAWAAAWVDDLGWVSFDVANRTCCTPHHVCVAVGLDYDGVAPVRGIRQGGGDDGETMSVHVRVSEAPQQHQQ
jgi:YD repeat-containing protein